MSTPSPVQAIHVLLNRHGYDPEAGPTQEALVPGLALTEQAFAATRAGRRT